MRLRASADRHEVRQEYMPTLWYQLVRRLQDQGKDAVEDIVQLMDSYFLTKDDWDAIVELGVGPMDAEKVKVDSQSKSAFTRVYNQRSHPLPFMKASNVLAPKKLGKERPDLEEAIEEDEDDEQLADNNVEEEDEELDLKKDKYVKAPKKRAARSVASKGASATSKKRKLGADGESEVEAEGESEEVVKPKTGRGARKAKAKK